MSTNTEAAPGGPTPVKVYLYGGSLKWTCFEPLHPLLAEAGVRIVRTPSEADVCVARYWRWKSLLKYRWRLGGKRFLLYNDEPNWPGATTRLRQRRFLLPSVHVMVPENGEIYRDVTNIFGWAWKREPGRIHSGVKKHPARMLCMLARKGKITDKSRRLRPDGYDLRGVRLHIAEEAQKRGLADIFGLGWADSVRVGESRGGDKGEWHDAKLPIMDEYGFAMAMENTLLENYVTEKIWDAVQCSALPLYYGNDWIYSEFPRDSFVDVRDFGSAKQLLLFLQSMSPEQIAARKEKTAAVYRRLYQRDRHKESEKQFLERLSKTLQQITAQAS